MKFFTLLHIDSNQKSTLNNRSINFQEQIKTYLRCVKTLDSSLASQDSSVQVVTNDKNYLLSFGELSSSSIIEYAFSLNIPSGLNFYSAHYKIELLSFLSQLNEEYIGIIDNDVICINNFSKSLMSCIDNRIPLYYNITSQVYPAYGQEVIISEKQKIAKNFSLGLWAGGEFVCGPPKFFKDLYDKCFLHLEAYFTSANELHHQGDEFLLSISVEQLLLQGRWSIMDAGSLNIITRFWSYPTQHTQLNLKAFHETIFLHLPNNKKTLASITNTKSSKVYLKKELFNKITLSIIFNKFKYILKNLANTFTNKPLLQTPTK